MNIGEAVYELDKLGSASDPIWHKGKETSPNSLLDYQNDVQELTRACIVRIEYYGDHGKVKGTLSGMVANRIRLQRRETQ